MVKLFSYGTLREQNVQQAIFGRLVVGTDDALIGYKLTSATITHEKAIAISGRAEHTTVVSTGQKDDQVVGIVFDLTEDELRRADSYEDAAYQRIQVRLTSGCDAWVYVKT
jgi:gamma-glutamylcyclotransferase (GGCT)/AIG2-like uncharacterized protein YtfP